MLVLKQGVIEMVGRNLGFLVAALSFFVTANAARAELYLVDESCSDILTQVFNSNRVTLAGLGPRGADLVVSRENCSGDIITLADKKNDPCVLVRVCSPTDTGAGSGGTGGIPGTLPPAP